MKQVVTDVSIMFYHVLRCCTDRAIHRRGVKDTQSLWRDRYSTLAYIKAISYLAAMEDTARKVLQRKRKKQQEKSRANLVRSVSSHSTADLSLYLTCHWLIFDSISTVSHCPRSSLNTSAGRRKSFNFILRFYYAILFPFFILISSI